LLLTYAGKDRDIADPWYTHNFDDTYEDIVEGCTALFNSIVK
jgi:protein-tyrosine phosphatase